MSQKFYKGRTNNHLTWVMVDATDFATPESAASAATTIKIYGKLRGQAAHNFVSSGTGSLTNDIQHVGASATGIYTIALAKADLSDASAAWYDQYIIALSCTGCARQTLVADGGIDDSTILAFSDMISNAYSAAAQANSRVLVVQSHASQIDSVLSSLNSEFLSRVTEEVAARSQVSDLASDLRSYLVVMSGVQSDIYSMVSNINSATLVAADVSDFASAVAVELSDLFSDIKSAVLATNPTASDIASVVWTNTPGAAVSSRVLRILSDTSQIDSVLSSLNSEFLSRVPKVVANNSQLSDLASDLKSHLAVSSGIQSDIYSLLSDLHSDVTVMSGVVSDVYSAVIAPGASALSDIASAVWARAGADPTTVPAVTATMAAKVDWLTALSRNKITQTSTVQSLRNDADAADIASAAVSDDGTTFTRGEFA